MISVTLVVLVILGAMVSCYTLVTTIIKSIIVVLLLRLFFMNREIKNIAKQLKDYNDFKTRKKLDINLLNKNIEDLAQSINENIECIDNSSEIQIENLFNKFYKADKARKVNSTGMGLSIVKELMIKTL